MLIVFILHNSVDKDMICFHCSRCTYVYGFIRKKSNNIRANRLLGWTILKRFSSTHIFTVHDCEHILFLFEFHYVTILIIFILTNICSMFNCCPWI